jgi:hypothetical protein
VVVAELPRQRLLQDADLAAHRPAGQPGQRMRVSLPGDERFEHVPAGGAEDVADHARQLDLGVFQQLLGPLLLPGALLDQGAPVPAQIPQLPLPRRRHERRAQHPPLGQLAQPDRIQPIRFRPARHVLNIPGVDHPAFDRVFEQVKRRLPVRRGGLHHAQTHPLADQPVPQFQQRPGRRRIRAHLLTAPPRPALVRHPHAAHQLSLADIQRSHSLHDLGLFGDLLHQIRPLQHSNRIPAAARRSQQGRQGGIACSRQQCRTLAAAPGDQTNSRAHSTKRARRRRTTTTRFSPPAGRSRQGHPRLIRLPPDAARHLEGARQDNHHDASQLRE